MTVVDRLLGLILGLALAWAGLLILIEAARAALGEQPWLVDVSAWNQALGDLAWNDPVLLLVLAGTVLLGLILLIMELKPRRPGHFVMQDQRDDRNTTVDRRGLEDRLRRRVVDDEDVVDANVRVGRRRARVTASVPPDTSPRSVRERLESKVRAALDELSLRARLRPAVKVQRTRGVR